MSKTPPDKSRAPDGLPDHAEKRVKAMLSQRLERGRISTTRPDWYFDVEADAPEHFEGGWQVRVRTWRHWSTARVHLNADDGEIMHRCVDRLSDPPTDAVLGQDDAVRIAAGVIKIPADAVLASFGHEYFAEGRRLARIEWKRVHKDMPVDGDFLWVLLHPETHRLVAFGRKWRQLR